MPARSHDRMLLRGVRVHNLQGIDLEIPLHQLVAITGVSGSGKSSLAFDTLFAEGQRRFLATCSHRVQQLLNRLERPAADRIENVPPAIAMRQSTGRDPATTFETFADVADLTSWLRIMFSRAGESHCPRCRSRIRRESSTDVLRFLESLPSGTRAHVGFTVQDWMRSTETTPHASTTAETCRQQLMKLGFQRVLSRGRLTTLAEIDGHHLREATVIVDRITVGKTDSGRLLDSFESAFSTGNGRCGLFWQGQESPLASSDRNIETLTIDDAAWQLLWFQNHGKCIPCGVDLPDRSPMLFNPRSAIGHCPKCHGQAQSRQSCPTCERTGVNEFAWAVQLAGQSWASIHAQTVAEFHGWLASLEHQLSHAARSDTDFIRRELLQRVENLLELGLDHLPLARTGAELSTGELQRASLVPLLAARLVNLLYVLDEPTAGLHPHNRAVVRKLVRRLQQQGNSVVVVEHDREFIEHADCVIEIGPGAGHEGGRLQFIGSANDWKTRSTSAAGIPTPSSLRKPSGWLTLDHVTVRNLNDVSVRIPLGNLCVVTGVSGSGKSALILHGLVPALMKSLGQTVPNLMGETPLPTISGAEQLQELVVVDDTATSRSARSNPAMLLGLFSEIRTIFAESADAKIRNFTAKHFSFNVKDGGRCHRCRGEGRIRLDMQFLADLEAICPECHGTRFRQELLEVTYRGRNIAEVLAMTIAEAANFFRSYPKLQKPILRAKELGLDYLALGQPAASLSGGELQRLKLAAWMSRAPRNRCLFVCDSATRGLHAADISRLIAAFQQLVDVGHSVIVIDHAPELLAAADHVIGLANDTVHSARASSATK